MAVAEEWLRVPVRAEFCTIIRESFDHVSYYQNVEESFHNSPECGVVSEEMRRSQDHADQVTLAIAENRVTFDGPPVLDFTYVDYEICTLRTTRSFCEDGRGGGEGPGGGSLDLLLANKRERLPIVAEIKAHTDRNPFLGLIQALNYATHLSTPHQRARLARWYPDRFQWQNQEAGPFADIYLIFVGEQTGTNAAEFLRLTQELAALLTTGCVHHPHLIRRVVLLHAALEDNRSVRLTPRFVTPEIAS